MSAPTFEEIVKAWVLEYDERLPNDRKERREAFIVLLGNLHDHGYGKEELNITKKEKVVRSCINPNHKNKQKLKRWISMVVNDLDTAILIYYGTVKIRRDVVTAEMSAKLESVEKKAEEAHAMRKPDSAEDEAADDEAVDDNKPLDMNNEIPLNIENIVKEVVNNPTTIQETFEITDEMLKDINEPIVTWDEDFSKRLGVEDHDQS